MPTALAPICHNLDNASALYKVSVKYFHVKYFSSQKPKVISITQEKKMNHIKKNA